MNCELPDVQAGFRKGRGTSDQIANIHWIIEKARREFQKYIYFCVIDYTKTRDLFKKIRDAKGTFHAKMGLIKDRNGMDLTEAEDIKKRWQKYTEELYKKDIHDQDNHDGITHLEPDTLECEVKWALESITRNPNWKRRSKTLTF